MTALPSLRDGELQALAERLQNAERAGDQTGAFRVLASLRAWRDAEAVFLRAGHSVCRWDATEFWRAAQRDVAEACRRRVDGFGLQSINSR